MKILKNKKYYLILISILIIECILIMINSIEYGFFHSNANTFFEKIIKIYYLKNNCIIIELFFYQKY